MQKIARCMWDMPHAEIKVNVLWHGHASDDSGKAGVAPHEMTVPAATDCRRASGCWHAHPYGVERSR
ncbi:hypothetical protein BN2476_340101 [Paraburkholderia piptadeniae]|uniref:Uncharacterized protein n=1 Tax=Paraburkholderia piptadeniae TaxID=1701573 RepID=A0A1N7S731_9BURK|nr:hypothetical protein BN2476_340101 [Paraburkholderia piptadeniae]